MLKKLGLVVLLFLLLLVTLVYSLGLGWFGSLEQVYSPTGARLSNETLNARQARYQGPISVQSSQASNSQILFGDLHVHTTYSFDAYTMSLPIAGGDQGPHTPADACDFARYCSALDFWSINDHAEQLTPRSWTQTIDAVQACNALAGPTENPDLVTFLGWEWTQTGPTAATHFGHKNVILKGVDKDEIPVRPIAAPGQGAPIPPVPLRGLLALAAGDQRTRDMMAYLADVSGTPECADGIAVRNLPQDCREIAQDPNQLFTKLDDWGYESMVIPHGTTWGIYTPPLADWRKQLARYNDPKRQTLVEVFSGHGNSERWIDNQAWTKNAQGQWVCPAETPSYLPGCQQAGRIIYQRCKLERLPEAECALRADIARQNFVDAGMAGHVTIPGVDMWRDWKDSAQCRDCFLPSFNYRRRGSAQYMLAMSDFSDPKNPRRLNFGFIAASDNHSAKPGTGYKELELPSNTDARYYIKALTSLAKTNEKPLAQSQALKWQDAPSSSLKEPERFNSFWYTGGLVAVHAESRARDDIWQAMQRKQTYGTSGPRILLWFDMLNGSRPAPMGSELEMAQAPVFRVRAMGSLEQKSGCPEHATVAMGEQRLAQLCSNECYNPSQQRRIIERIEVVRIRPQQFEDEAIDPLIEDAWRVFECSAGQEMCEFEFTDEQFVSGQRDVVYYARVIEQASATMNAAGLGCEYDDQGVCLSIRDCGSDPAAPNDCLSPAEHRAWSSPIFVNFSKSE